MKRASSSIVIGLAALPLVSLQALALPAVSSASANSGSPRALVRMAQATDPAGQPTGAVPAGNGAAPSAGPQQGGVPLPANGSRPNGKSQRKAGTPQTNTNALYDGNGLSTNPPQQNGVVSPYVGQVPNGGLIPSGALMPDTGTANGSLQPNGTGQSGTSQANGSTQYGAGVPTNRNASGTQDDQSYYTRRPLGASPVTRDTTGPFGGMNGYDARGVYTGTAQQPYSYGQVYATTNGVRGGLFSTGVDATGPLRPFVPLPSGTIRANSGYGLPNGSRPMHMDARGIQRYD